MTTEIEEIKTDDDLGITYWTSKAMATWLMANTNESDIIVFRPTPLNDEEEPDVVLDYSLGAIELEEFTHILGQSIQGNLGHASEQ